jgi:cellulose synthase (UDP-forming)
MNKALTVVFWIAISAIVLVLVTVPVSLQAHLVMGVTLLGAMLVIKVLHLEGNWRLLLLTFGTIIVLRYAFWRTTSTLPPIEQWTDFIPGLILYLAEMYCILMLFLSLFVVVRPMPSHVSIRLPKDEPVPTVDVFIPS